MDSSGWRTRGGDLAHRRRPRRNTNQTATGQLHMSITAQPHDEDRGDLPSPGRYALISPSRRSKAPSADAADERRQATAVAIAALVGFVLVALVAALIAVIL